MIVRVRSYNGPFGEARVYFAGYGSSELLEQTVGEWWPESIEDPVVVAGLRDRLGLAPEADESSMRKGTKKYALCDRCDHPMAPDKDATCVAHVATFKDGGRAPSTPHVGPKHCHDCNVAPGGYHHSGCDMERCPRCVGQRMTCDC